MSRIPRFSGLTGSHQMVNSKTEENFTTLSSSSSQGTEARPHLCVGDRVVVNGDKFGTLRFIGPTEFKPGEWCGIELDDTRGLNDGSVDGVRYFQCEFKKGLFVPSSKVQKLHPAFDSGSTVRRRRLSQSSAISQESEGSFGCRSLTSSQRNHPPTRLGNTKLMMKNVAARSHSGQIPVHISLQRSLKEKDLLVEKLLIERDLERLEFSRAAEQVDHAEKQFSNLESQYRAILQLAEEQDAEIKRLQLVNEETLAKCEEQKLRSEDLEFQLEELRAASSEQVVPTTMGDEEIKAKIVELNANILTADLQAKKAKEELKSEKDKNAKLSSHIESLENELRILQSKSSNKASTGKESMEKELDALKSLCEELEKSVLLKNKKIDELEQVVFELTENAEEQKSIDEQNQIADAIKEKERMSVFESLLQKLEHQAACLADYPTVLKRNADLVDEKNLLEKEYSELTQVCMKLSEENKLLKKSTENNTNNVKWDSVVNKYEAEIASLKDYITTLEEEKLPALGQQLMDLMGDIHHKENEIIEQKKTIKNLETRIADFESQNRSDIRHNGVCHYNHIGGTGMLDSRKMLEEQSGKPSSDTANEFYDAESDFKKSSLLRKVEELEKEIHLKDTCIAESNAEHTSRIAELLSKLDETDKEHSSLLSDIKRMEEENNRYREKLKMAESINEKYKLVIEENERLKVNITRLNTIRKSEDELMDMFRQLERISKIREQEAENLRKELTNCKLELDAANKTINLFQSCEVVSKNEKDGKV